MSWFRSYFAVAAMAVLAAGCAAQGARTGGQHNVVTSEDLTRAGDVSLYDALVQIRPSFLRARVIPGASSAPEPVHVFVDGLKMEGIDYLRQVMARNVKEVRYLEPQQANARFGGNNSSGALVITMS